MFSCVISIEYYMENLRLCAPAFLYVFFSLVFTVGLSLYSVDLSSILIHLFTVATWTFFLQYLCQNNFTNLSWILLILPLVGVFVFLMIYIYLLHYATPVV